MEVSELDEKVCLSTEAASMLLTETQANFFTAHNHHPNMDTITTGTLALFLVEGLAEGLEVAVKDQETRALMLREMGECLAFLAAKYNGGSVH